MEPRATLETLQVYKSLDLFGNRISILNVTQNLDSSVFQPMVQSLCRLCSWNDPSKVQNTAGLYETE